MSQLDLNTVLFMGGVLLTFAVLASKLSAWISAPILLLFLGIGMATGEEGFLLHIVYNDYASAYYISNLMLAIIILDGGLRTNLGVMRRVWAESTMLATVGVVVTSFVTAAAVYWFFDVTIPQALLVGATVGSTDAAAVFSLLGNGGVSLKERVSSTLQIESATNDQMAILLAMVLLSLVTGEASSPAQIALIFVSQFGLGIILGIVFGLLGRFAVATVNLNSGLYAIMVVGIGLTGFSITAALGGSGFLAIFIIGMLSGNQNNRAVNHILPVGEGLTWLAQITLFLLLGWLVTPSHLLDYALPGIGVALVLTFLARPIAVFAFMKPFFRRYSTRDLSFMSWVGLRGSVPIVLAIYPTMEGAENAELYFNIAFVVVLFSLLVQGTSLLPMARLFRVYAPQSAAPLTKSQVGITLSDDYELYNYPVRRESLNGRTLRELRFPKRTQVAALFRDGHMLKAHGDAVLEMDDIVSIIGHAADEAQLNAVFSQERLPKASGVFEGGMLVDGTRPMTEMAKEYGMELTSFEKTMTVADFMSYHIGGFPQVGEKISLIDIDLTVVELKGDYVSRVGITRESLHPRRKGK